MIDILANAHQGPRDTGMIRAAYFELEFRQLEDLLLLPDGVRITAIRDRPDRALVEIRVEGGNLPETDPSMHITKVNPQYRSRCHHVPEFHSWGI